MKKILVLAANAIYTSTLRLDVGVQEIQAIKAINGEEIEIISGWTIRVDDLRRTILHHEPNIVHFCGNASGDNGLVLENKYGQMQFVNSESLGRLFQLFEKAIECVVLDACYTEVQAEVIHQHINCVVGTNKAIGDKAAIDFATNFFDALTDGRNYQDSFYYGCNAIDLENIPQSQMPQIKIRKNSKSLVDLREEL